MTEQAIQNKNGLSAEAVRLVEEHGFSEQFVRNTPKAALVELCKAKDSEQQAQEKAEKAKSSRPPKKSAYEKFMDKCDSAMGEGVYKMVSEYYAGHGANKDDMGTTDVYMARRYGPVVIAVLYEQGLLSQEFSETVAEYYS